MTTFFKRTFFVMTGLVLMIIVSACGSTSSTGSTQSTPTSVPAKSTPTITSTSTLQTAQATVDGKTKTILTDAYGMTLYYFIPDAPTRLACSADCAQAWPPLLSKSSDTPTSTASLPGTLSILKDANGNQIEYSGYLLYTYRKDKAPGDVTGQGVGKVWYVATPDLASYVIRTANAAVAGKAETILVDAQGLTLYYFTPDSSTKLACSGDCAQAWPPLLSNGSGTPLIEAPFSGKLSIFNNANGKQIEYNGHLLYTYVKDAAPGVITGQGVGGKWFVATPGLSA
jgi:predicted lipoprotein with Yx(FWY)xxD motif